MVGPSSQNSAFTFASTPIHPALSNIGESKLLWDLPSFYRIVLLHSAEEPSLPTENFFQNQSKWKVILGENNNAFDLFSFKFQSLKKHFIYFFF